MKDEYLKKLIGNLNRAGFEYLDDEADFACLSNGKLRIGIFSYDYPNSGYSGSIKAEHENNFDKWSKSYYSSNIPKDYGDVEIIMCDIVYIQSELNEAVGNNFGNLYRSL